MTVLGAIPDDPVRRLTWRSPNPTLGSFHDSPFLDSPTLAASREHRNNGWDFEDLSTASGGSPSTSGNARAPTAHGNDMPPTIPPKRFQLECASMRPSRASLRQLPDGELCWCEVLTSNLGREYHVVFLYPPRFPYERVHASIVHPELPPNVPHRYLDEHRPLCLFPSPDDPTLSCTAGTVRARTALWIFFYELWTLTGVWEGPEVGH